MIFEHFSENVDFAKIRVSPGREHDFRDTDPPKIRRAACSARRVRSSAWMLFGTCFLVPAFPYYRGGRTSKIREPSEMDVVFLEVFWHCIFNVFPTSFFEAVCWHFGGPKPPKIHLKSTRNSIF